MGEALYKASYFLDRRDLGEALGYLRQYPSELQLFSIWCARRVQHAMLDERSSKALGTAEQFVRGRASRAELNIAVKAAFEAYCEAWDTRLPSWNIAAAEAAMHAASPESCHLAAWTATESAFAEGYYLDRAYDESVEAQIRELDRVVCCIAWGMEPYPEMN